MLNTGIYDVDDDDMKCDEFVVSSCDRKIQLFVQATPETAEGSYLSVRLTTPEEEKLFSDFLRDFSPGALEISSGIKSFFIPSKQRKSS